MRITKKVPHKADVLWGIFFLGGSIFRFFRLQCLEQAFYAEVALARVGKNCNDEFACILFEFCQP